MHDVPVSVVQVGSVGARLAVPAGVGATAILNFHRIESPTGLEITRLAPARFCRFLDLIDQSGLAVARSGGNPLDPQNRVVLTFDDGFASIAHRALPEIQGRGWTAIVFLIAGSVGKTDDWDVRLLGRRRPMMNWDDIRRWSDAGIEFGSHTMSHADLTALSGQALKLELTDSKSAIEDALGQHVRFLSYPFGRHNACVQQAAAAAGYDAAFATGGRLWSRTDKWAIPRVGISALTSLLEFRTLLRAVADTDGGEGQVWRQRWPGRVFESLNAGSATIGNWRRARRSRLHPDDHVSPIDLPACDTSQNEVTGAAGSRSTT
jgi:peptidoglycan/xylan/chitin deacetylase (PgdA/CDA1 family)